MLCDKLRGFFISYFAAFNELLMEEKIKTNFEDS